MTIRTGKVIRITTDADGNTTVHVYSEDYDPDFNETFTHPTGMTQKQLDEFKRAQNHDKTVTVDYDENNKVETVTVNSLAASEVQKKQEYKG